MSEPETIALSTAEAVSTANAPATKSRRSSGNAIWYGLFAVSMLFTVLFFWWMNLPGDATARTKNQARPEIEGQLSTAKEWEWTESPSKDDRWEKLVKALANAKAGVTQVTVSTESDPWRSERWEVEYRSGHTLESYVREISAIGIVIGLVNKSGQITYLDDLTNATPGKKSGNTTDEQRYYMLWRVGALNGVDKKLFSLADVKLNEQATDYWVAHFFPTAVETQMQQAELAFAKGRPLSDIRRTTFSIKPVDSKFIMAVLRQEYQDGAVIEVPASEWGVPSDPKPQQPSSPKSPGEMPPPPEN